MPWQVLYSTSDLIFKNITRFCKELSWSRNTDQNILTFNLILEVPKFNNEKVFLKSSDNIIVIRDDSYNQIILNGKVRKPSIKPIKWNPSTSKWDKIYTLTIREKDFSKKPISKTYINTTISEIIQDILTYYCFNLGGIKKNGEVLEPFIMLCANQSVDYYEINDKRPLESIKDLLDMFMYSLKLRHHSEADNTYTAITYTQLIILDSSGEIAPPEFYINDEILRKGEIYNYDYQILPNQRKYLKAWGLPEYSFSEDDIINYLTLNAKVLHEGNTETLERYEATATEYTPNYTISYAAREIAYVCNNPVIINITEILSSTEFYISKFNIWAFEVDYVIRLTNGIDQDFRKITAINTTTGKITIDITLTFTLAVNDALELVNNLTLYLDNQVSYQESGVVIDTKVSKEAKVKFLKRSIPNVGSRFTVWYSRVQEYLESHEDQESIEKYDLKHYTKELESILTKEQIRQVMLAIQQKEPNVEVIISCFIPSITPPEIHWSVPTQIDDDINKNLRITNIESKYLGFSRGKDIVEYIITLSDRKFDFNSVIKAIEKKAKDKLVKLSAPPNLLQVVNDKISIIDTVEVTLNKTSIAPVALPATLISNVGFTANLEHAEGATSYIIRVYQDDDFNNTVVGYTDYEIGYKTSHLVNNSKVAEAIEPIKYVFRAKNGNVLSTWSNPIEVPKTYDRYYFAAPKDRGYTNIWSCRTDGSDMQKLSYFDFARRPFYLSVSQTHDIITYTNIAGSADEFGTLQVRFNNKIFSDEKYTNVEYGSNARGKSPICVLEDNIYSVKKSLDYNYNIIQKYNVTTNTTATLKTLAGFDSVQHIAVSPNQRYLIIAYQATTSDICIFDLVSNTQEIRTNKWGKIAFFGNNDDFILCNNAGGPTTTRNKISNPSFYTSISLSPKSCFVCQIISNDTEYLTIELGGGTWIGRYNTSTLAQISLIKVSDSQDTNYNFNHVEMALSSPLSFESQFPESIYVDDETTDLDYGYIFDPQYKDDFTDYSFQNQKGIFYAENGNTNLDHPHFDKDDNDKWYIDFNRPYPTVFVVPDGSYELGSNSTITMELDKNNTGTQTIICKWWDNASNGLNSSLLVSYVGDELNVIYQDSRFATDLNDRYLFVKIPFMGFSGSQIVSVSLDCNSAGTPIINVVQNQTTKSYSLYADGTFGRFDIQSVYNTPNRMAIGHRLELRDTPNSEDWAGNQFTGKLKGLAIIKQSLSDAQIKEIHRLKGYE